MVKCLFRVVCYGVCIVQSEISAGLYFHVVELVSALCIVWRFNIPESWRPGATEDVGMLTNDQEK